MLKLLYFSLIHSKLLYGIEVYANTYKTNLHDLSILNNRLLRIVLGKDRFFPISELYKIGNTFPIENLFKIRLLLFAHSRYNNDASVPNHFHNAAIANKQIHNHNTRNKNDFYISLSQSITGSKATITLPFKLWNSLPSELKRWTSPKQFKNELMKYFRQCDNN